MHKKSHFAQFVPEGGSVLTVSKSENAASHSDRIHALNNKEGTTAAEYAREKVVAFAVKKEKV